MDTSETYIKMCEKVSELQHHILRRGDYFRNVRRNKTYIYSTHAPKMVGKNPIWLPHQDQLQEMIYNDSGVSLVLRAAKDISNFVKSLGRENIERYHCTSMEQFWLTFVMKEKYNKVWTGDDWIIEN